MGPDKFPPMPEGPAEEKPTGKPEENLADTRPEQAITPEEIETAQTAEAPAMPESLGPAETPKSPDEAQEISRDEMLTELDRLTKESDRLLKIADQPKEERPATPLTEEEIKEMDRLGVYYLHRQDPQGARKEIDRKRFLEVASKQAQLYNQLHPTETKPEAEPKPAEAEKPVEAEKPAKPALFGRLVEATKAGWKGAKEGYREKREERERAAQERGAAKKEKKEKTAPKKELSPDDTHKFLEISGLLTDAKYDIKTSREFERAEVLLSRAKEVLGSIKDKAERKRLSGQIKELEAGIKQDIKKERKSEEKEKTEEKKSRSMWNRLLRRGKTEKAPAGEKLEAQEALKAEAQILEKELKETPKAERAKIGIGLSNFGFFVQEWKSKLMEKACRYPKKPAGAPATEQENFLNRFLYSFADTYKRDAELAQKKIEAQKISKTALGQAQNVGYLMGNILKYGRTVADIAGWTAGSPLRWVMMGALFFTRGAGAAKEARLLNEKVIAKTRIEDVDQAAEQAWQIYEEAQKKAGEGNVVSKEYLEKAYVENLPQDLIERLKKAGPGITGNFFVKLIQAILRKDVETALKIGSKMPKDYFEKRLKELDRVVGQYGTIDGFAMAGRYAETAGKGVIVAVQIETLALLIKNLPEIMHNVSAFAGGLIGGESGGPEVGSNAGLPGMPADVTHIETSTPHATPGGIAPLETPPAAPQFPHDTAHVGAGATPDSTAAAQVSPDSIQARVGATPDTLRANVPDTTQPRIDSTQIGARPDSPAMTGGGQAERPIPPMPAEMRTAGQEFAQSQMTGLEKELHERFSASLQEVPETAGGNYTEVAERGDSVWSMAREQLEKHYGQQFTSLNEAQQTYMIDSIKDRIVANPGTFGLTDPDRIAVGQEINFSSVFSDQNEIQADFTDAHELTGQQISNIQHNNELLRQWVNDHPSQSLTSEQAERVLSGGVAEATPEGAVTEAIPTETVPAEIAPETIISQGKDYIFETISGTIRGHFNLDGGNISGVVLEGPNNFATTERLFTSADHLEAATRAANAGTLPEGYMVYDGVHDIHNRASQIDKALRFRNALPEDFPNRQQATDYLNGFIRRMVRASEEIYGNVYKSESRILQMRQ